jgi:hypothetical protein
VIQHHILFVCTHLLIVCPAEKVVSLIAFLPSVRIAILIDFLIAILVTSRRLSSPLFFLLRHVPLYCALLDLTLDANVVRFARSHGNDSHVHGPEYHRPPGYGPRQSA